MWRQIVGEVEEGGSCKTLGHASVRGERSQRLVVVGLKFPVDVSDMEGFKLVGVVCTSCV